MGVFDETTPAGSDPARDGDDRMRELKVALGEALSHEDSTFPGASPSTKPIFIPGFLRGNTAARPTGDSLVEGRLYINSQTGVIERYNGSSWDEVGGGGGLVSGTKMVFYQASAPTGWTAVPAISDRFLRTVSGGTTGGTTGGSGLNPSSTITLAHSHTVDGHTHTGPSHTHSTPNHQHRIDHNATPNDGDGLPSGEIVSRDIDGDLLGTGIAGGLNTTRYHKNQTENSGSGTTGAGGTGNTGSASPGTNSQLSNTAFQYADVIVATKD